MRTQIDIDNDLMDEALSISGLKTKRDAVEAGLRLLIQIKKQEILRNCVVSFYGRVM